MKRRGFLGFFAGAAVAGPSAVKAIADDSVLMSAGFPMGGEIASAAPNPVPPVAQTKLFRWIKKNGIPEWKMQDIRMRADHDRSNGIDPDLAALRSVSAGFKAREQRRRNMQRRIDYSILSIDYQAQRRTFSEKVLARFGHHLEWYD